jgi:glyoxylase-like metal-dependent hydrolase (beta-lactamase superfamily II)
MISTVPEPTQTADGVWSTGLPFPSPLGFAFSYLVPVADGLIAVDVGWDSPESWAAFLGGLWAAGAGLEQLRGVVITHVHPDHYGLAQRIREQTGAWIALHPAERPRIAESGADRLRALDDMVAWLRQCGTPDSEIATLHADELDVMGRISMVQPDHELVDGQRVPDTDGALVAVHTPGHTPGHLCFHDRSRNLIFTGDHILPRVTPNVSKRPGSDEDPLADFRSSVTKLRHYDGARVLPGHEWAFDGLGDRLDYLLTHHDQRLAEIEAVVARGASTVWDVATSARWSRPFTGLDPRARRSAIGETHSHLRRLAGAGRVVETAGTPSRWTATELHE